MESNFPFYFLLLHNLLKNKIYIFTFYIIYLISSTDLSIQYIAKDIFVNLIKHPLFMNDYWFIWAYLMFLVIIPVLNRIRISKRIFSISIVLLLINCISARSWNFGSNVFHFCCVYIASKYLLNIQCDAFRKSSNVVLVTIFLLVAGENILKDYELLGFVPSAVAECWEKLSIGRYGIMPFFMALSLFNLFQTLPAFSSKVVNVISSSMLGVYLFHCNAYFLLCDKIPAYLMGGGRSTYRVKLSCGVATRFILDYICSRNNRG